MLHIAMHATIAEESGEFTFARVLTGITDKLVRRHPHVFGVARAAGVRDVLKNWEQLKLGEGRRSVLEGILQARDRFDGSIGIRCSCRQAICGSAAITWSPSAGSSPHRSRASATSASSTGPPV